MKRLLIVLALGVLFASSACTKQKGDKDALAAMIYRTETLGRAFTVTNDGGSTTRVSGVISDDYRYRAAATVDGKPTEAEIVFDDARAVRTPRGTWEVDPHGATSLFTSAVPARVGREPDPIKDSLEILKYVRTAIAQSANVVRFNPESQDYRPKFDPFPRPTGDVIRYDLLAPSLTPKDPTTSAGGQLPGVRYFRKMSVYVRAGRVESIRERISVEDTLRDPRSRLASRIGDYGITVPDGTLREQARYIEQTINATATRLGQPPLDVRDLDVRFSHLGERPDIALPANATKANLKSFDADGQILFERSG